MTQSNDMKDLNNLTKQQVPLNIVNNNIKEDSYKFNPL